jgi:CP family cyanate transporter-like MFS transporter
VAIESSGSQIATKHRSALWAAIGFVLVAANLRPAVVAVAPLLDEIRAGAHLNGVTAGLLTTLPLLCFGLLAPVAPRVAARFGIERTLFGALVVLVVGSAIRLIPSVAALFVGTLFAGAAIAFGNVLLPSLIKRDFAHRAGLMTALYSTSLSAGGAMAAGITIPVARAAGWDSRQALGAWGLFALVALVVWAPRVRDGRAHRPAVGGQSISLLRDPLAWQVTGFMGLQSLEFYALSAWLPALLATHGVSAEKAGWLLSLASLVGLACSMVLPVVAARMPRQRALGVGATLLCVVALFGLLLAPSVIYLWMVLLGLGQGAAIALALTLIVLRSPDSAHTARLSGMAQSYGYLLAAAGPLAVGGLHDLTHSWQPPLVLLLVLLAGQLLTGLGAGRDRLVGATPRGVTQSLSGPTDRDH